MQSRLQQAYLATVSIVSTAPSAEAQSHLGARFGSAWDNPEGLPTDLAQLQPFSAHCGLVEMKMLITRVMVS